MITQSTTATEILIASPYNKEFVSEAKQLGGKWRSDEKAWAFPLTRADAVRDLCARIYGSAPSAPGERGVTVRITAKRDLYELCAPVLFAGRGVVRATGRDSGARPGEGCAIISGRVTSGGSVKNWQTCVDEGAVVEIENMDPAAAVETDDWSVEIAGSTVLDRDALLEERAKLAARLAEIDKMLEG